MTRKVDVLVIGAGPGGYPTAIRSAQLGKSVIIIERQEIGGECLNWGCIPSKALIEAADFYHDMFHDAPTMGITVGDVSIDMKKVQEWKVSVKDHLINGIKQLLKTNKVVIILGKAHFVGPNLVDVTLNDGSTETIEADDIIIATGAGFRPLKGFTVDGKNILSVRGTLNLDHIPEDMVFIGGGFVGLELGTVFAKFGSHVQVVELQNQLLPGVDPKLVRIVSRNLKELGADIYLESGVKEVIRSDDEKMKVIIEQKSAKLLEIPADKVVVSIGKIPTNQGLGLENAGIVTNDRGWISVDIQQKTNVPHHYAVGDCTGGPFLAHRATKQGLIAAEVIAGLDSKAEFKVMPGVIFTDPEIAFSGLSERDAKKAGYDVITGVAPWSASGRALTKLETKGYVKAIVEVGTERVLGVEIVGPHASDLISEVSMAIQMDASAHDVSFTIHPHPTLSESIMEAFEAALGMAIHVMNKKRKK
jgi:dihydrolipoamide dehydrogenase